MVDPVPVLLRPMYDPDGAVLHVAVSCAAAPLSVAADTLLVPCVTCADAVNPGNRPNTNPAIAIAAMSVIAMRMTVAMTGEIALRFITFVIFIELKAPLPLK